MARKLEAKDIPIGKLYLNGINVRKELGDITDLENSIEAKGILQPIIVRPGKEKKFAVIIGGRRFRAGKNVGLKTIPAIIRDLTDDEAFALSATENLQRKNLDPNDEAEMYNSAMKRYGSQPAVADAFNVSRREVQIQLEGYALIRDFRAAHGEHVRTPQLPEDRLKTDRIHRAAELVFPDSAAKRVEMSQAMQDYDREDVRRAIEYVKATKESDPEILKDEPVADIVKRAFRVPRVGLEISFDSRLSRAIIKAAEDRSITWEDIVRVAVEAWLKGEGFLE